MFDRLEDTVNRYEDITAELGNPDVVNDQEKFRKLMKEQSSLAPLILSIRTVRRILRTVLLFLMKRQMKNLKRWRRKNLMNLRQE